MRFPWISLTEVRPAPYLPVGIRRNGVVASPATFMLVDTGADETLLNFWLAKHMGFQEKDLESEGSTGASGAMTVYRPKDLGRAELEIGGTWYRLPGLRFGKRAPVNLLGRDMVFAHFELRMTARHFYLLPRGGKR